MNAHLKGTAVIGRSSGPPFCHKCQRLRRHALDSKYITTVYGANHGIKGVLNDRLMIMDQEEPNELARLLHTPSSTLGCCCYKIANTGIDDTDFKRIPEIFQKYQCNVY